MKTEITFFYVTFYMNSMSPYSFAIVDKLKKQKIQVDAQEEQIIMKSLKNRFIKSDFDERSIRLYVEIGNDKIYVDSEGRVLFNKDSYYIHPSDFLTLFLYFEGFKQRLTPNKFK